jgi:L-rhamnose-H+ transport protein
MTPNPLLGVCFHWLGGLASGSFYVAYRGVRSWAWETYWLAGGIFSWVIAPWLLASTMTNGLIERGMATDGHNWFFSVLKQ